MYFQYNQLLSYYYYYYYYAVFLVCLYMRIEENEPVLNVVVVCGYCLFIFLNKKQSCSYSCVCWAMGVISAGIYESHWLDDLIGHTEIVV